MAIDRAFLGEKVSRYREQQLGSIDDVSQATGIAPDRLSRIERGETEPTGDEVLILADYFHCDFRFFISNARIAPFEETAELYRAHGNDFTHVDRRAIQEFLYLCETEAALQADLSRPIQGFNFVRRGSHYKSHGEAAAAELRRQLGFSDDYVPEDVYAVFRGLGIHVFRRKLQNSGISGLFVQHPLAGRCALVNFVEDVYRQRFSAAHEVGHAIFDADESPTSVSYEAPDGQDLVELRANRFASCFLMPPSALRRLPSPSNWTDSQARDWAQHFRVSCAALAVALSAAGVVDDAGYRRIYKLRLPKNAKVEPELSADLNPLQSIRKQHLLERGLSDAYVGLCFDALHAGRISVGRLAEALLSSTHELGELAALYGRSLHGH